MNSPSTNTTKPISSALSRIKPHITNTEILSSEALNKKFAARIFFKCENLQKTNSFKARGAINAILSYQEKNQQLPQKIVVVSSGNHAQAVAFACQNFGLEALVFMAANVAPIKVERTRDFGAQIVLCEKRWQANEWAKQKGEEGYLFIHPSANQDVIEGQGTACYEALQEIGEVDAIFAPVGGGGLVAGCYLAAQEISPSAKVFGCEPKNANDAAISVKTGKIFAFEESPDTIADGARTLAVLPICFEYLKKLDEILEISEEEILRHQEMFEEIFAVKIEPTSALAFAGALDYLKRMRFGDDGFAEDFIEVNKFQNGNSNINQASSKFEESQWPKILVVISGGNL